MPLHFAPAFAHMRLGYAADKLRLQLPVALSDRYLRGRVRALEATAPASGGSDREFGTEAVQVNVRSVGLIKTLLGQDLLTVALPDGATIDGLLASLRAMGGDKLAPYLAVPKEESAHAPLRVMVNGRDIVALEGRRTRLRAGDDVLIFVPIAGG